MATETNLYTHVVNNQTVDIFSNAEPYFYGDASPNTNYFKPLGSKDKDSDNDYRIQGKKPAFAKEEEIPGFTWGNNKTPLKYIKKGTFPIIGPDYMIKEWSNLGGTSAKTIQLTANYNDNETLSNITIFDSSNSTTDTLKVTDTSASAHRLSEPPSILGFILVGAGGHAGGISQYDTKANGSTKDQYAYGGSGGGGGEVVWGILDLTYPKQLISKIPDDNYEYENWAILGRSLHEADRPDNDYIANDYPPPKITSLTLNISIAPDTVGGGEHGDWKSCSHNKPQLGKDGNTGAGSYIYINELTYKLDPDFEDNPNGQTLKVQYNNAGNLVFAYGGEGGFGNYEEARVRGGYGGGNWKGCESPTGWWDSQFKLLYISARQAGGTGGKSNYTSGNTSLKGLAFDITLCKDYKDSEKKFKLTIEHDNINGTGATGTGNKTEWKNTEAIDVPGGHSFGTGASKKVKAGIGGGGACSRDYNSTGANPNGGGGYFALYY